MYRWLAVLRFVLVANAVGLNIYRGGFEHPVGGALVVAGMVVWTFLISWVYHAYRRRTTYWVRGRHGRRPDGGGADPCGEGAGLPLDRPGLLDHGRAVRMGDPLASVRRTGGCGAAVRHGPAHSRLPHRDRVRELLPAAHRRTDRRPDGRLAAPVGGADGRGRARGRRPPPSARSWPAPCTTASCRCCRWSSAARPSWAPRAPSWAAGGRAGAGPAVTDPAAGRDRRGPGDGRPGRRSCRRSSAGPACPWRRRRRRPPGARDRRAEIVAVGLGLPRQRGRARRSGGTGVGAARGAPDAVQVSVRDEGPGSRTAGSRRPRARVGSASRRRSGAGSPSSAGRPCLSTGSYGTEWELTFPR